MRYMDKTIDRQSSQLEELFLDELRDLYGAEQHQLNLLPLLKHSASSLKLKNILASHLDDTREQILRLEAVFERKGQQAEARSSEAILGISREAEKLIAGTALQSATRDAGIIVAAQKLEHYEITSYGSLAQHARTLGFDDIDEILETSLMEEKELDDLLTALAENYINGEASREGSAATGEGSGPALPGGSAATSEGSGPALPEGPDD
jgi:ferritin-like metal-binding protein YciE